MRDRRVLAALLALWLAACAGGEAVNQGVGTPLQVKGLELTLPAGWKSVPPSSPMRAAQVVIDGPGGPAEMAVFHFGTGQGGDVEANVQRWLGQIVPQPGTEPQRKNLEANGLRITFIDAEGTLQPGQMGVGPQSPQPGSRLLGAVLEGDGGPWFLKATGPDLTLAPQRVAFIGMLQTARPAR
ncbi:MAG: hypothetical protein SF182_12210 [Deltaproteobacteria bacterium]|nr:hypothetical protein [Deltaproteobacteria bacterium]